MDQERLDEIRAVENAFEVTPKGVNNTGEYLEYLRGVVPELIEEIERLRGLQSPSGVTKTMAKFVAEVERLEAEVERLRLVFAFHCKCGTLSLAQAATALNMSQTEVMELTRKLPSPDSHRQTSQEPK